MALLLLSGTGIGDGADMSLGVGNRRKCLLGGSQRTKAMDGRSLKKKIFYSSAYLNNSTLASTILFIDIKKEK